MRERRWTTPRNRLSGLNSRPPSQWSCCRCWSSSLFLSAAEQRAASAGEPQLSQVPSSWPASPSDESPGGGVPSRSPRFSAGPGQAVEPQAPATWLTRPPRTSASRARQPGAATDRFLLAFVDTTASYTKRKKNIPLNKKSGSGRTVAAVRPSNSGGCSKGKGGGAYRRPWLDPRPLARPSMSVPLPGSPGRRCPHGPRLEG